ncbi:DoxX family protein [uncultured Ralstonia sp.]|uniref:DoxX family protein n=1 Tax=uncultured Ralstonia sp. TaxID=114715 RepID=UPI0025FD151A|nr:DoxX family protein [uncultured Ralstonia sp.]
MVANYVYWSSTVLLSLLYLASVSLYVTKRDYVRQAQAALGYSAAHLVPFMIIVKILGPVAILSRFSVPLSDLAYAGLFYHLILSGMAHLGVRQPKAAVPAAVGLVLLVTSFVTQNAAREVPSPYAPSLAQPIHQPLN